MSASFALRAPRKRSDERDAARIRFHSDVDIVAARAPSASGDDLGWLVARAFASGATDADWTRLHRAVARLLDGDALRVGASYERLRGFVLENDDVP